VLTFPQAIILGLIQGVTELFPISSLGHSVILPQLFGWTDVVAAQAAKESYFLAFLVGLHVATATALLIFYRATWIRIVRDVLLSIRDRRIETAEARLGWLLIVATIPAGLAGLLFEHTFRVIFATPEYAAIFLIVNGVVLAAGERLRRRGSRGDMAVVRGAPTGRGPIPGGPLARGPIARGPVAGGPVARGIDERSDEEADLRLGGLGFPVALVIGVAQTFALLAGISRSGITMVAGLVRGLDHKDAARFSFLLATPIILAAGVYKLPDLIGPNGDGVRVQVLVGSIAAGIAAYLSVRFLTRYFTTRTLNPFAIYCVVLGVFALLRFA